MAKRMTKKEETTLYKTRLGHNIEALERIVRRMKKAHEEMGPEDKTVDDQRRMDRMGHAVCELASMDW